MKSKNFVEACEKGESYNVKHFDENKLDELMVKAAEYSKAIVRICKELESSLDREMVEIAEYDHEYIVEICKELGASLDGAMIEGAEYDQAIVRICKEFAASLKGYKEDILQNFEKTFEENIRDIYRKFFRSMLNRLKSWRN